MPRTPRRILEGRVYEVTHMSFQGRYLSLAYGRHRSFAWRARRSRVFGPCSWLDLLSAGVLAYADGAWKKEVLCPSSESWPGVQSAKAWLTGLMKLEGVWVQCSGLYELERQSTWKMKVVRRALTRQMRPRGDKAKEMPDGLEPRGSKDKVDAH